MTYHSSSEAKELLSSSKHVYEDTVRPAHTPLPSSKARHNTTAQKTNTAPAQTRELLNKNIDFGQRVDELR